MSAVDVKQFGRVAVVMGGDSAERQVSLWSGEAVLRALKNSGVDVERVDGIPALLERARSGEIDRVFNILHGRGGEDGVLQGALEALKIPYTGSGVLGSALTMDKHRTKQLWLAAGLPTPPAIKLHAGESATSAIATIGLPVVVKPIHEGSSVGVTKVYREAELASALDAAARTDGEILIERLIEGPEYTVGILDGQALPSIRIQPADGFYDFNNKYLSNDTQYHCPSGLSEAQEASLRVLALQSFDAAGCLGWGRIDVMADRDGGFWLLEVNTAPGMTDHSLVPKAAAAIGIDFPTLCLKILKTSLVVRR
jgi:D-alanine-D-alanine ligase